MSGVARPVVGRGRVVGLGRVALVWRPRHLGVVLGAVAATAMVAGLSTATGDVPVAPARLLEVLTGGGTRQERLVVTGVRAPRVLLAVVVGVALGAAGAITQAVSRNALASPDLLGVTGGASAGAVAVIVLGGGGGLASGALREVGVPLAAQAGGIVAALAVVALLRLTGTAGATPLLVGVGVSSLLSAAVGWLLVLADVDDLGRANVWLTGSLNGRSWPEVGVSGVVVLLALVALVPHLPALGALSLGPEVARGLGLPVTRTRVTLLVLAVVLCGAATAVAGPVGFVALVCPHLARLITRAERPPVLASAALGALLVVSADLVARTAAPVQLPVGAVTALVGAPFMLWLLLRPRREAIR